MSMSLRIHTVCDEDIIEVKTEPMKFEILHYGELLDPTVLEDLEETQKEQLLLWKPKCVSEIFYLEAAFQSLHYLLSGETEWGKGDFPLNFITGQRLPLCEVGWGRANFYTSSDVKIISDALNRLNMEKIKDRFDADFFNIKGIYPKGYKWTDKDADSLLEKLKELSSFVNIVANNNLGFYIVLV